jgi:hypothetical protein
LDELILKTSKTSALRAINLNKLLSKKWTEEKNAYKILSNIKTEKQSRRIASLLQENRIT